MKKPFEDLNTDIPYLDRSVIDEKALHRDHIAFRKNGYLILVGAIPTSIIDAFKKDKSIYTDIALHTSLLSTTKDVIGDEMLPRYQEPNYNDPLLYNCWCCTAFVALEDKSSLDIIPASHKEYVGVVGEEIGKTPVRWEPAKGDAIILHTAISHKNDKGLLPIYYVGSHYNEKFELKRAIRSGWKTLQ